MNISNTASTAVNHPQPFQLVLGETAGIPAGGIGCKSANGYVDLTTAKGRPDQADGEVILVRGTVRDENGQPIEGALVELRQANRHGRYSHEADKGSPLLLDPNFEGRGEMTTGVDGSYGFRTIKPGMYAISGADCRTPHIHFKISCRGYHEAVTQLFFEGEALNKTDMVLLEIPEEERAKFVLSPSGENGIPVFNFDISLHKLATYAEHLASLDAFVGSYDLVLEGEEPKEYKVRREGNQLYLEIEPFISVQLTMTAKDEFLARPISRRCIFNRAADGSVGSLTFEQMDKAPKLSPQTAIRLL
jgi:protocatechuate 3,4-dioxygenase, beta subunit